jgi:hypothetical protein
MPRRHSAALVRSRTTRSSNRCRILILVDNAALQAAAWKRLSAAQKKLEKATHELHRFEQEDQPAFQRWLQQTFPQMISELRELAMQFAAKSAMVDDVEREAWATGRTPTQVWRRRKDREASGESADLFEESEDEADWFERQIDEAFEAEFAEEFGDIFRQHGIDPNSDDPAVREFVEFVSQHQPAAPSADAKAIYRRLVQRLHPDSGGEWTRKREALWHEVQRAWEAQDADWLARLEAELDVAEETLGPASPVGRLYDALREIDIARRQAERTVAEYRKLPPWKFSLITPNFLHRQKHGAALRMELEEMKLRLAELERMISGWERSAKRRKPTKVARRRSV